MRPDPHKQKASRRYQAKHKTAAPTSTQEAGPSTSLAEQSAIGEDYSGTGEHAEAREEEDINEFLRYLKDESQRVSTEQSAVYFQLRAEAESAELGIHNEGVWQKLLDVNWDSSLKNAATNTTLQRLLDTDYEFAPAEELRGGDVGQDGETAIQATRAHSITRQLNAVDLAPNAKSLPVLKQQTPAKVKSAQPADDLEAFLDDLL
ncbi:hypothetical protein GGH91_000349 [Coemansia sp. RSA 2671]|nr:hypothetical protein LPJ60_000785 [Coemansia sp. RSA 2675]KAJ2350181.1 hypothetical protein GGH91_000349 [Coemansia sp. RSA 2671]KAJ2363129.1 hypothetical protein H4S02_011194 [Coemansia sp. RSA 2611]